MVRSDGRAYDQMRPLKITYGMYSCADASVLCELGNTKVLCAVSLQHNVPPFLRGKKIGWLTAEYAMLPTATQLRTEREGAAGKRNGRALEISRLIGRALRSVVNLDTFGERTIVIDCDVLQADGSTRTACITGAYLALRYAVQRWLATGQLGSTILTDDIAAVSVGMHQGRPLLDLNFAEDSAIDADFNFVMTRAGAVIEIQGAAERLPIEWSDIEAMRTVAYKGICDIFKQTIDTVSVKKPFNSIRPKESSSDNIYG